MHFSAIMSLFKLRNACSPCQLKISSASQGSNPCSRRWTSRVRGAVKLKKKACRAYLSCRNPDNANGSRMAKSFAVVGIANAKIQVWEAFGEVTQKDFGSAPRRF